MRPDTRTSSTDRPTCRARPPLPHRAAALLLAALLAGTVFLPTPSARAQLAVYDPANHTENLQQTIQAILAVLQRIEQIRQLYQQIDWMLEQLEGLEDPPYWQVATLLHSLNRLLDRGDALVYSLDDLIRRYRDLYRGHDPTDEPSDEVRHQVRTALDTVEAVLESTRRLSRNYVPAQQALGAMKAQLKGAETNAELLQASGLITAWSGEETSKVLQQLAALTNLQAVRIAHQVNGPAMAEATLERWMTQGYRGNERYDASDAPTLVPAGYPGAPR